MAVRTRITLLFTLLVVGILTLVCASVYYFSYTNRIKDIQTRLANRAITTGRLLSQGGIFDQALIRKIDASTSVAMKDKVVEAYDNSNKRIYWYSDTPADTLRTDTTVLDKARKSKDRIYFTQDRKDAIAYYYNDETSCFVIIAAAYDEPGNEKLRHLRLVLSLSFIGGILTSVIGGYFFSIRLLQPLRRIADEVNEISARNLTRRIHSATEDHKDPKDEWAYLSDTLNRLLNRLQESFEIQGRFIANASHELSTPLTSISSQLEVALQRVRTIEEYRQVIQSVYQDAWQLGKLTQTLLEFARASGAAGGLEIDLLRIDEILLRLPAEITKANPLFSVTLDFDRLPEVEEELLVFGNEELLFTAIRNIVSNACKYSDDHHATVRLVTNGHEICISIEDKGRGIGEEEWEKIFQPFYRSDDSLATPGFGLGLSLARRILQLHKGSITVQSVVGKGSIFSLVLPSAAKL
ncbi:sensor histidine kinase [Puia dinghuensis]|uniref:histidine kinase n=1 Tax=Puia dinghuensis TaxID=1792502 RepID=A0A8J2UCT9_9BACT|nr:HAMP domain-containing sensor histidine kinase [Puia dinghuensis]GGA98792.1 two-component sensor histidine kinase [Puia dinghuensis]